MRISVDEQLSSIQSTETDSEPRGKQRKRDRLKSFFHPQISDCNDSDPRPKALTSSSGPSGVGGHAFVTSNSSLMNSPPLSDESSMSKNFLELNLEFGIPEVCASIRRLEKKAEQYQRALSMYHHYTWVLSDHDELRTLVKDLDGYTSDLEIITKVYFRKMPTNQKSIVFSEFQVPTQLLPRDPKFCGREDILAKIKYCFVCDEAEKGTNQRRIVVLTGLGGIGKSQIALEYGYRHFSKEYSVFWINAANQETINLSSLRIMETLIRHYATKYQSSPDFARIAIELGIPGMLESSGKLVLGSSGRQSVWDMVRGWLSKAGNTDWCLVIDGYDDMDLFNVSELLPECGHGHIIVTSRDRTVATHLHGDLIDIHEIEKEAGLDLLLKAREAAEKTIEILGGLPLALAQAAAYMLSTMMIDFVEYLKRLSRDLSQFLGRSFPPYQDGVFSCWKLSVEAVNRQNPDPIGLLQLCAFLSGDGIPEELLYRGVGSMHWLNHDRYRLDDSIDELVKFFLMIRKSSLSGDGRALWIHPLVQVMARESYEDLEGQSIVHERNRQRQQQHLKKGAKKALCLVGTAVEVELNFRQTSDWAFEKKIMTHLRLCCGLPGGRSDRFGTLVKGCTDLYGSLHKDTLRAVFAIMWIYEKLGRFEETLELAQGLVTDCTDLHGEDHSDTKKAVHCVEYYRRLVGSTQSDRSP
ncbi:P-loop containing nucleoside triphosphate hydrolase protein [Trichophaea hybrida]|nr:P-loop containing nucleoside triphosphate hydrolase protein [Trichophaea hybrida]